MTDDEIERIAQRIAELLMAEFNRRWNAPLVALRTTGVDEGMYPTGFQPMTFKIDEQYGHFECQAKIKEGAP